MIQYLHSIRILSENSVILSFYIYKKTIKNIISDDAEITLILSRIFE